MWGFSLVTVSAHLISAATKVLGPVSCPLLSLTHLIIFLYAFSLAHLNPVESSSLVPLCLLLDHISSPSAFLHGKDYVVFHISLSKGSFIPK